MFQAIVVESPIFSKDSSIIIGCSLMISTENLTDQMETYRNDSGFYNC
jgi:hypothetical protein